MSSEKTFNYIVSSMGEAVILTLTRPATARINQFFTEQRKQIKATGQTDEIIAAQNIGRRAFFDEAAGIRQYQIKRDQAMNKFKLTRENLVQTDLLSSR